MAYNTLLSIFLFFSLCFQCYAQDATLVVDGSKSSQKKISDRFFGVFFEEINHAGAGGLWAEMVSNRGFEQGGPSVPSNIHPWKIIGDDSSIYVSTDRTSCFECNKVALRMEVFCGRFKSCPPGGVGVSNPGYWGMNVEKGKKYKVVFYVRTKGALDLEVSLVGSDGSKLATNNVRAFPLYVVTWKRMEIILESGATNHHSSLQIITRVPGIVWLDQVSAMPLDTYKGHGFRKDLFQMVADLKPKFMRFPGGSYIEGNYLRNAFRWKDTVGPWEERPGHVNDVWNYWTDDAFGYFEGLQLAEDLGALPVWVFHNGLSIKEGTDTSAIAPFIKDTLDGLEFARGPINSKWGALRALMGHPAPFDLRIVAIGNEECWMWQYHDNYLKFYNAIKKAYPDIQIISNCDGSQQPLNHPADLYDFHKYTSAQDMFNQHTHFDNAPRSGPKAFVSEYAVWQHDAGNGTLLGALGEAAFLMGLEKNSDVVDMVGYAPLFVNANDRKWTPDAIVFDSHRHYGTPSYWLQRLFIESSGATLLKSNLQNSPNSIVASAIEFTNSDDHKNYIRIKVVNFGGNQENLKISINGLSSNVQKSGSTKTVMTSSNVMDQNSFENPTKIAPVQSALENANGDMTVVLPPHSVSSFDLLI